ncbi:ciliary microtubule inner protein 1-like [Saccoglossus kowalevskii]|uniref:Uncharacterized protein C20orf85 homolog n=1 Tax=Saccoglossus kowalevskii TaxID=10224 RepID=A0ABM0M2Q4_SACKO|nr:PREDICTED: uncharacterized protein C20orf85 homolog [Saccoglossus kowalevskii]
MMFGGRKVHKISNFVHNDEIWKDHVNYELQSLRKWPDKWGFLTHEYNRMHRRLIGETLTPDLASIDSRATPRKDCGLKLPAIQARPNQGKQMKVELVKQKSTQTGRPMLSAQFPRTTAEEIGWKSAMADYQLEMYGRYLTPKARGQQGIRKMLNWPYQGLY